MPTLLTRIAPLAVLAVLTVMALATLTPLPATADGAPRDPGASSAHSQVLDPITAQRDASFALHTPAIDVTPSPRQNGYAFDVRLTGHQAALDLCAGWVFEDFIAGDVVSAHHHCGGAVVLTLKPGDAVTLTGYAAGTYTVTELTTVPKYSPASVLEGGLWMQTCFPNSDVMRLARLTRT